MTKKQIQKTKHTKNGKQVTLPKKLSQEQIDMFFKEYIDGTFRNLEPSHLKNQLIDILENPDRKEGNRQLSGEFAEKVLNTYGLETDYSIVGSVAPEHRGLAIELKRDIIKEYGCTSHLDKSLVDTIVVAYCKILYFSRSVLTIPKIDFLSNVKTGHYGLVSRELDKANRQYLTGIQTLKQLKAPNVNFNIKMKNAYLAQNQQFNQGVDNKANNSDKIKEGIEI